MWGQRQTHGEETGRIPNVYSYSLLSDLKLSIVLICVNMDTTPYKVIYIYTSTKYLFAIN